MPPQLRPTFGIQLAPPAVAAATYASITGGTLDVVANALIGYALLQALLLARMGRWITKGGFSPGFWGFSFGATSLAGTVITLSAEPHGGALGALAPVTFAAANGLIVALIWGTVRLLLGRRLFLQPAAPSAIAAARP